MKEEEVREMCFEDRGRDHKPRTTGNFQKLEKAREQILPWSLWEEHCSPDFSTSDHFRLLPSRQDDKSALC